MKYQKFEDLPVWKTAIDLAVRMFELPGTGCLQGYSGLKGQIERASVLVSNNIAEGFERGTREELVTFLYIARGSSGEVRSMLCLLERLGGTGEHRPEIADLKSLSLSVTRQLNAWLESLKNSKAVGHRHQTVERRRATESERRRDDFLTALRRVQEGGASPLGPRPGDESSPG